MNTASASASFSNRAPTSVMAMETQASIVSRTDASLERALLAYFNSGWRDDLLVKSLTDADSLTYKQWGALLLRGFELLAQKQLKSAAMLVDSALPNMGPCKPFAIKLLRESLKLKQGLVWTDAEKPKEAAKAKASMEALLREHESDDSATSWQALAVQMLVDNRSEPWPSTPSERLASWDKRGTNAFKTSP